jgi:hypothetical protein
MGCYVNPETESKEAFLEREGMQVYDFRWNDLPNGMLPVVLLSNYLFTAAGVAYSKREFEAFTAPGDPRPRKIYLVPIDKLLEVSDLSFYL